MATDAADVLGRIGPDAASALPPRPDGSDRLDRMGPTAAPAHPRTRAPAHPRTRAPAHPRTRAPAHPRTRDELSRPHGSYYGARPATANCGGCAGRS
ncbi:hypothetical protein [Streptomyces sp. NPDC058657]|uniref:hypothetical protein n=1 Tax=unclassified Streptomyces TaxID=2593676 RepID=UPI003667F49F